MAKVVFLPWNRQIETARGETLLELARTLGLPLEASCGGRRTCGKCKVVVEQSSDPLPPPSEREKKILGDLVHKGYRLACEATALSDLVVRIPEESLGRRQVVLTSGPRRRIPVRLRPPVLPYPVEVAEPVLHAVKGDRERLADSLRDAYGLGKLVFDPFVLREIPVALRAARGDVTALIRTRSEAISLRKGRDGLVPGIAFDIGTTTVVAYLLDLSTGRSLAVRAALNPQVSFGADVVSRISVCQEDRDGLEKLRSAIVGCLNGLIEEACGEAGIAPAEVLEATVVGNTVMNHLLLGLDPRYLALAPYPPVLQAAQDVKARDLGIRIAPSAYLHLLPLKAGFVGSDTVACVLATGLLRTQVPTLLIDLGTNGEIVMAGKGRLLCCSTAAGPAFEGGHLRFGMRAAPGAIERVRIDPATLEPSLHTIDRLPAAGICGSGVISAVAEMVRAGIVLRRGNFNEGLRSPRVRRGEEGWEYVLSWASENAVGRDIVVTRKDVSELQLAKSAVHAGACLLEERYGSPFRRVLLAGACGNYMDPLDALAIGLIPENQGARIVGVGNAAGHGACLALLDMKQRRLAERVAREMEYVELSGLQRFSELFVSGMAFPSAHEIAGNTNLLHQQEGSLG
jgi:uncharacterized 2Fe-2S/4Fe-4S cluster protein (DUF4445 family)